MKKLSVVPSLIVLTVGLCSSAFGATEFVIANANSVTNNRLLVYKLDATTGALTQVAALVTGGTGGSSGGVFPNFFDAEQAISPNAQCIFAIDENALPNPSDIASFSKALNYARVGNYSDPALQQNGMGGSLVLSPDGKFLYASYSQSDNIAEWAVNQDCSLTLAGTYEPDSAAVGSLKIVPNGKYLVAAGAEADLFSIDQNTGALANIGYLSPSDLCGDEHGCALRGVDFTKDSRRVVFASNWTSPNQAIIPIAISALITPSGFKQSRGWSLKNDALLGQNSVPFFSAAGFEGSGNIYFGTVGNSGFPGVITANFSEKPLKIDFTAATAVDIPFGYFVGAIAATGNTMVIAEYPNEIGVYRINQDGSLTQLSTTTVTGNEIGVFSLSVFPNTR
jgi:WD40 repeat protein